MAKILTDEVRQLAQSKGVNPLFALSLFQQESSSGRNTATSSTGNRGVFQMSPATFEQYYPGGDIDNPAHNAIAAVDYMKWLLDRYHGDYRLAAQAWYGGVPIGYPDRGGIKQDQRSRGDPRSPLMSEFSDQVTSRMALLSQQTGLPLNWEPEQRAPVPEGQDSVSRLVAQLGGTTQTPAQKLLANPDDQVSRSLAQLGIENVPEGEPPPGVPSPYLMQLAQEGPPTPTLNDIAVQTPVPMQPQQPTGVAALLAKMYGATDPDTGIPLDVAWGLRDPGIETRDVDQTAYLRKLVDSTLSGERYG